jgi:hypothetical protein
LEVTASLSDVVALARRVSQVDVSPQFDNYSKVVIHVSDDTTYVAGNDTGRTLEIDNPFGTQAMANNMLASLTGYQYQPYQAQGALLDPAAEIGDAVNMRGAYGGIYTRERTFGRLMKADVSAPHDEEINHEYKFETPQERQFRRQIDEVKASLIIANDRIDASVTQTGGSQSSFGWSLTSNAHRWYANGKQVMAVTASGLSVTGAVTATSGKIGNFNIAASAIWNNISSFGGSQSTGVYLGTNGIQLGQNFKVDSAGNGTMNNLKLTGTLNIGGTNITAAALRSGAQTAYNNSGTWNGTSTTVSNNGGYWSGGASYGYNYNNATISGTSSYPTFFTAGYLYAKNTVSAQYIGATVSASVAALNVGGTGASWKTASLRTSSGGTVTIHYLGY